MYNMYMCINILLRNYNLNVLNVFFFIGTLLCSLSQKSELSLEIIESPIILNYINTSLTININDLKLIHFHEESRRKCLVTDIIS